MAVFNFLFLVAQLIISALLSHASAAPKIIVTCFDCGPGISRLDAGVAARQMCIDYYGIEIFQNQYNSGGMGLDYVWSGGEILLTFHPFWDELGCTFDYNEFFLNSVRCYYDFMAPIDYCNTGGVNGKQGGYYWDQCGNVTINPHPHGASGCPNSKPNWSPPNVKVVEYHATDAQHEAAVAAVSSFELSGGSDWEAFFARVASKPAGGPSDADANVKQ